MRWKLGLMRALAGTAILFLTSAGLAAQGFPTRSVILDPPEGAGPGLPTGRAQIFPQGQFEIAPPHQVFGSPFLYSVRNVVCRGPIRVPAELSQTSLEFYVIYLTIGTGPRIRLQSFNTTCDLGNFSFSGDVLLAGIDEEDVLTEDLTVEVFLEEDDGEIGPNGDLVLIGQD